MIEREGFVGDLVEPDFAGAGFFALGEDGACFLEEQDGGLHARVGLEHICREGDDGFEGVFKEELAAQFAVSLGAAEENAIRHDDGGTATDLEQVEHEPDEEQLALGGDGGFAFALAGKALAVLAEVALVHAAGEGRVPLGFQDPDQAAAWFHPRLRSAVGTYRLTFNSASGAPQPRVQFVVVATADQVRLDNLEGMFGLSEFWGCSLDDEVQSVAGDVQGMLAYEGAPANETNVRDRIRLRADQERKRIGRDGLAIVKSHYYEHIAQTPVLLGQIVRTCAQGT